MPIIIKIKPKGAPSSVPPVVARPKPEMAASEAPRPVNGPIKCCKYCGHQYINGGCNFERQKKCENRAPGEKKRVIATKSLD